MIKARINQIDIEVPEGTSILEAARQAARPPRFIFSSTGGAIYGDFAEPPSAETEPKDPESPYGIAKLAAAKTAEELGRQTTVVEATEAGTGFVFGYLGGGRRLRSLSSFFLIASRSARILPYSACCSGEPIPLTP